MRGNTALSNTLELISTIQVAKDQYATRVYNMYVDPKEFGANGTTGGDASGIQATLDAISANGNGACVRFTMGNQNAYDEAHSTVGGNYVITTDLTFPVGVTVSIQSGVTINIATGKTVTFNAQLDCPDALSDVFIGSGSYVINKNTRLDTIETSINGSIATHLADVANPHSVTKDQVGLGLVPNTDCTDANNVGITDTGAYYTGTDTETALQELGSTTQTVGVNIVKDQNGGSPIKFWVGTSAEYALLTPDADTLYFTT